ncbi:MAG: hypothetical protein NZZ41_01490 [Candidatus Dojkabacteria bacterium]|nr:hypothetical protein [Candidatus Dojkabacteria bacterium]
MIFLFFPILYIENTKRYTQNNMYDSDGQIAGIYTEKDKNDESSSTQTGNLVKLPLIVRTFNLNNIVDIYYLSGIALVFFGISFLILSLQYFLKR